MLPPRPKLRSPPRPLLKLALLKLAPLALLGCVAASLATPSNAQAWVQARTAATGAALHWPAGSAISWRADTGPRGSLAFAAAKGWLDVRCAGEALPWRLLPPGAPLSSTSPATPSTDATSAATPLSEGSTLRVIAMPEPWPVSKSVFAYTAVVHNAGSGEIRTFQMRLNGVSQSFCVGSATCAGAEMDLPTVLAHEWGHVWGLGHSAAAGALMAEARLPGEVLTAPTADDRAGLCAIVAAPRRGAAADTPTNTTDGGGGCSASSAPAGPRRSPLNPWIYGVIALLMGLATRSRRAARWAAPLVVCCALLPLRAEAYVLAHSASGAHQRWYVSEVPYSIERDGLVKQAIDDKDVVAVAAKSFATWAAVQCPLCHDPRGVACAPVACAPNPLGMGFVFVDLRPEQPVVGCKPGTGEPDQPACDPVPNGSFITFVDHDWPHGSTVIATTLVVADTTTGEIVDADILFNTQDKVFCLKGAACKLGEYDLQNTMTHEIGHLLGMDHSLNGEATMFGGAPPGEIKKRDLLDDDIAGVCRAYRQAWTATGCPAEEPEPSCCSAAPDRPQRGAGARFGLLLCALAAAALVVGQRRRA